MKRTFFALIIAFVFVSLTSPTFGQAEQKKKKDNPAASANTSSRSLISSSSNNTERTAETFEIITVDDVSFKMIFVSGGVFRMGCTSEVEQYCWSDEYPSHDVTLDDYYIGETEVTQDLWQVVMGTSPTGDDRWTYTLGLGDNYPAYRISYEDVKEFITRLNSMTGRTFRMPTEAEWEFAARGGNKSRHYMYSGSNNINDVAWCLETADGEHNYPVKQKKQDGRAHPETADVAFIVQKEPPRQQRQTEKDRYYQHDDENIHTRLSPSGYRSRRSLASGS